MEIISGKLCNTPSISFINKITTKCSEVRNGDIFVARDKNDLQNAIKQGAYGIVSDTYLEILDDEIAWILVDNIDMSLLKFVKYIKLINNIEIYTCDKMTFRLAKHLIKNKQIAFASNVDELVESLFYKYIIIDFEILLFEILAFCTQEPTSLHIIKQTLFEIKVEYHKEIYQLILPSIWTQNLSNVIYFCKSKHFEVNFNADLGEFLPIFINSHSKISQYGQSMRFIYASKQHDLIEKYIEFVLLAKWGRALFLTPKGKHKHIQTQKYSDKSELMKYFCLQEFHFFIVLGLEQDEIIDIIADKEQERSLFAN